MIRLPQGIGSGIIPGHVHMIPRAIQLHQVPAVVHAEAGDHDGVDAQAVQQHLVGLGIAFADGGALDQGAVGIVGILRHRAGHVTSIIVGDMLGQVIVEHQGLLQLAHVRQQDAQGSLHRLLKGGQLGRAVFRQVEQLDLRHLFGVVIVVEGGGFIIEEFRFPQQLIEHVDQFIQLDMVFAHVHGVHPGTQGVFQQLQHLGLDRAQGDPGDAAGNIRLRAGCPGAQRQDAEKHQDGKEKG